MPFGGLEILVFLLVFIAPPVWTLRYVASRRGASKNFQLWGFLSYVGLVIGLLVMIALPQERPT